jgi:hypothetical protein
MKMRFAAACERLGAEEKISNPKPMPNHSNSDFEHLHACPLQSQSGGMGLGRLMDFFIFFAFF